ncbi:MAG: Pr6Pr family membrane protein [Marivita lacus]|nr:Pr6Pr family membrane protein [Marivita lacus]
MILKRTAAALLALGVFAAIVTRIWLRMDGDGETFGEAVWAMYRFYTIWTNTLIGLACGAVALGRKVSPQIFGNLLLSIIIVAAVYHALLAHLNDFTGLDAVVDALLHTAVPVGFGLFWVTFVSKADLRFSDILPWLILPLIYCIYAMARAQVDGVYPYFFLNLDKLGLARTALNIVGLLIAFAGIGALIVLLARGLTKFEPGRQVR